MRGTRYVFLFFKLAGNMTVCRENDNGGFYNGCAEIQTRDT